MSYIGNSSTFQTVTPGIDYFSGNASTTTFQLTRQIVAVQDILVYIDNVPQNPSTAYSINTATNQITFTSAPLSGTNNIWVYYNTKQIQMFSPAQGTVTTTSLGSGFTLPVASGGTGVNTVTSGQVLYGNGTSSLSTSANMTFNGTALTLANDASISGLTVGKGTAGITTNTALGLSALLANTTGYRNTAVGGNALKANTTGVQNTAVGLNALTLETTGVANTAIGDTVLANQNGASYNTGVGNGALNANTTASYNTAVGYQAGYYTTTGQYNTYIGQNAGNGNQTSNSNTFVGQNTGQQTTGGSNSFFGQGAGNAITSGSKNTVIGVYSGNNGGLDIRTASNNIVLSDGDGNPRAYWDGSGTAKTSANANGAYALNVVNSGNSTPYGQEIYFSAAAPNNATQLFFDCLDTGAYRLKIYSNGGIGNFQANNVNLSDEREKKDIELANNYLDKICAIPVKTFLYNDQTDTDLNLGVIAQDVQAIAPELVLESNWGTEDEPKMRLSIYQTDLQYAMMKAIQELNAKLEAQALEIATLKAK